MKADGSGVSAGMAVLVGDDGLVCSGSDVSDGLDVVLAATVACEFSFVAVAFVFLTGVGVATMIHGVWVGCMPATSCAHGVVVTITILGVWVGGGSVGSGVVPQAANSPTSAASRITVPGRSLMVNMPPLP